MQTCIVKVGEPGELAECGQDCEYLNREKALAEGRAYVGWYHVNRDLTADHHAVPKSWI